MEVRCRLCDAGGFVVLLLGLVAVDEHSGEEVGIHDDEPCHVEVEPGMWIVPVNGACGNQDGGECCG